MKTLYFDCFAGASGNMILGGLIGLGIDSDRLVKELEGLSPAEFSIEIEKVDRSGISAVHAKVVVPEEKAHRHLRDVEKIIRDADLAERVKERALAIFTRLAEAEAKVHGLDIQKVHFHEVGAMDSIVDVVGSCIGFELLGVDRFVCSKIHVGSGFVQMAHGTYPVPPPAVAELLKGLSIYSTEVEGELITPTGAAIISALCDSYWSMPEIVVEQTGYGAGSRQYPAFPNALRLMLGETAASNNDTRHAGFDAAGSQQIGHLIMLETNIDDISPQVLGFVMERSLALGALDCWFTPIQMKKNRPATKLSILCALDKRESLMQLLYAETTTLGIRSANIERHSLPRETVKVRTEFGEVDVKVARFGDKIVNVMPEYENIRRMAIENDVPFRVVHEAVITNFKGLSQSAGTAG